MYRRDEAAKFFLLCTPALLLLLALVVVPVQSILLLSFVKSASFEIIYHFGLSNYYDILGSWVYMKFWLRSVVMAALVTAVSVALAWPAAYWIAKFGGNRRTIYLLFTALPFFTGLILRLVALQHLFGPGGLVDGFLTKLGLEGWSGLMFSDIGTFIGLVYLWLPFAILALYLSFNTYPFDLERVAAVHGASQWSAIRKVALPMNAGGVIVAAAVVFLPSLGASTEAVFLGGPDGSLLGELIRRQINTGTWPRGATLLVLLLATSVASIGLMWSVFKKVGGGIGQYSRASLRMSRTRTRGGNLSGKLILGATYAILYTPLFVLVWVSFSSNIHRLVPVGLTFEWYQELFSTDRFLAALGNSILLGLGAATVATIFSSLAAFSVVQYRVRAQTSVLLLFLSPLILTPLALGISAKLVFSRILSVPGGLWPSVFANATYVFSFGFLLLVLAFSQHDWAFERAARVCGASALQTFRLVTFPWIFPALLGAFLVSALISFNNYHITFFTAGATPTLPTMIGGMLRHGLDEEVYALTVLSIIIASLLTLGAFRLLALREQKDGRK